MTPARESRFAEDRRRALADLIGLWGPDRFVLIGATAMTSQIERPWRATRDIDLCVTLDASRCVEELTSIGWSRRSTAPQRWHAPMGAVVDVIPVGDADLTAGVFIWAGTDISMSTTGLRLAFADTVPLDIGARAPVRMASLPAIVVLKIAAYFDRPWERKSDLGDISQILAEYRGPDHPDRWTDEVLDAGVDFDDVSPFLLGAHLAQVVVDVERDLLDRFLRHVEDPDDPLSTAVRMASVGAASGWSLPSDVRARMRAFRRGLSGR